MLPANPLPQLVPNRIASAVTRLAAQIWQESRALDVECTAGQAEHIGLSAARRLPRRRVRLGEVWGRLFDQRWCRIVLPRQSSGTRYLEWRDQGEATLYIDGEPFYGFDVAHRYCALAPTVREVWLECICVQTGIWHAEATGVSRTGSVFGGAFLVSRNDEAWHAYHDLHSFLEVMLTDRPSGPQLNGSGLQAPLDRTPVQYRRLLRVLDEAVDTLDADGLPALRRSLARSYEEFREAKPFVRAVLTGHAHIDLVWLWPEKVGEAKAVHTFATADRLMSIYPEFRFAYSQPASYAAVGRRAPGLLARARQRFKSGKWEATGALYVESDTLLACGEALARSFILGQEDFTALRGSAATLVWLPDCFGYSACLPQLMRLSGVDYFFTNKVSWSAINGFPVSSFVWRGADGSEVIAHVQQGTNYNGAVRPDELRRGAEAHQQADVHPEFLFPTGYGDGGGGVTEEMCERARRLSAMRGYPAVSWDQPEAFFGRLAKRRAQLPSYVGECYLEYHRGTYTTHGRVKAAFRSLERALQLREAVAVAKNTAPDLGPTWRRMVFSQFHDYIPGSSIPEVYAEGLPELHRLATEQQAATQVQLSAPKGESCVFNPLPLARQCVFEGRLVQLPPLAGVPKAAAAISDFIPVQASGYSLTNGRVEVRLNRQGELAELNVDGKKIAVTPGTGQLVTYPDRAANYEAWDIDRQALALGTVVRTPAKIAIDRDPTGLRAALVISRRIGKASAVTMRYILEANSPVVRIEMDLDWHEPETLLKLHFATGYRGINVRCGAPFGSVLRPQQPGSRTAEAMWEIPASRYVAVADDGGRRGFCVVTEAKYGFCCRDGDIGVSLVRSPRVTGFESFRRVYPPGLSRLKSDSIYSDQGLHRIALGIGRYDVAAPRELQPAALADLLFTPPVSYRGKPAGSAFKGLVGGETLVACWAKPETPNRWTLRLHEVAGERGIARVLLAGGWKTRKVDLRGRPISNRASGERVEFRPYEIVSLEISR